VLGGLAELPESGFALASSAALRSIKGSSSASSFSIRASGSSIPQGLATQEVRDQRAFHYFLMNLDREGPVPSPHRARRTPAAQNGPSRPLD
jgi:lipase chaperone LimK